MPESFPAEGRRLLRLLQRVNHVRRDNRRVELFRRADLESEGGIAERQVVLVSVVSNLGGILVTDQRRESRDVHQGAIEEVINLFLVRGNAVNAVFSEGYFNVGEQTDALQQVVSDHGLEDVQFEVALGSSEADRGVVAHHLNGNHRDSLTLGRIDLARHDGGARFVRRNVPFTEAAAGAGSEPADVVRDLHQVSGEALQGAFEEHDGVVAREAVELVGIGNELEAGGAGNFSSNEHVVAFRSVQASTDGGAADGEFTAGVESLEDLGLAVVEHRNVAGEFLAKRQRRGVLEMRTASLDDVLEGFNAGLQRAAQTIDSGDQQLLNFTHSHDVQSGRERIVRGLAAVHVVVRVNEVFLLLVSLVAEVAAEDFGGAVRDDFVHVHVGLRAGAGLPDSEREVISELSGEDLVAGLDDRVLAAVIEIAELIVHNGGGTLQIHEGAGDFSRHLFRADLEILIGALGLGSPVLRVINLYFADGVMLNTKIVHEEISSLCKKTEFAAGSAATRYRRKLNGYFR